MPYAQVHYPFENKERFEKGFPADFIAEGLDQTRGWFYTLMVLSTALFDKPAFKNLIVNGLVLAADGKKMSKRLQNYPDPMKVVHAYGADALRLYLVDSPVVRAEPLRFAEAGVLANLKEIFIPWYNAYRFFVQQAQRVERDQRALGRGGSGRFDKAGAEAAAKASGNVMDRWILASLHGLVAFVRREMENYRLYTVVPRLVKFIDALTNWYVRLNRLRLKGAAGGAPGEPASGDAKGAKDAEQAALEDTKTGLSCLYTVLLTLSKLMAPFTPFFAEYLFQKLDRRAGAGAGAGTGAEKDWSVHFEMVPVPDEALIDEAMERTVGHMQDVISAGRLARGNDLPLKRPLREMIVAHEDAEVLRRLEALAPYVKSELNVRALRFSTDEKQYCTLKAVPDGKVLGKRLGKGFAAVNKAVRLLTHEQLSAFQKAGEMTVEGERLGPDDVVLSRKVLVDEKLFKAKVTRSNLTVVLDTFVDKSLMYGEVARQVASRVQRLRKAAGVNVEDVLDVYFGVEKLESQEQADLVAEAVVAEADFIRATLRTSLHPLARCPAHAAVLASACDEVAEVRLTVTLANRCPLLLATDKLAQALGVDAKLAKAVAICVTSMDYNWLAAHASKSLEITLEGTLYKLECGAHYALSLDAALP